MLMLYLNQYIGRAMLCLNPERHCQGKAKSHEDRMSVVIFGNSAVCIPRELQWEEGALSEIALSQCCFISSPTSETGPTAASSSWINGTNEKRSNLLGSADSRDLAILLISNWRVRFSSPCRGQSAPALLRPGRESGMEWGPSEFFEGYTTISKATQVCESD